MTPFSPQLKLDESEIQFLRDNRDSTLFKIIKKTLHCLYEEYEHAWMKIPRHDVNDLLVMKGEKMALIAVHNYLMAFSQDAPKVEEKRDPSKPVR